MCMSNNIWRHTRKERWINKRLIPCELKHLSAENIIKKPRSHCHIFKQFEKVHSSPFSIQYAILQAHSHEIGNNIRAETSALITHSQFHITEKQKSDEVVLSNSLNEMTVMVLSNLLTQRLSSSFLGQPTEWLYVEPKIRPHACKGKDNNSWKGIFLTQFDFFQLRKRIGEL